LVKQKVRQPPFLALKRGGSSMRARGALVVVTDDGVAARAVIEKGGVSAG
jgi:hypothetical protein